MSTLEHFKKQGNGIVANYDNDEYRRYMAQRTSNSSKQNDIDALKENVSKLEDKMSSIESLLQQVLQKVSQ